MKLKRTALGLLTGLAVGAAASAQADDIDRVLLISVDGLHALDVARYVESHPASAMAELSRHGITYSNARTPANSDSFPGLTRASISTRPRTFRWTSSTPPSCRAG
jgi:hypothetical protein